jgi:hypothetical protein
MRSSVSTTSEGGLTYEMAGVDVHPTVRTADDARRIANDVNQNRLFMSGAEGSG